MHHLNFNFAFYNLLFNKAILKIAHLFFCECLILLSLRLAQKKPLTSANGSYKCYFFIYCKSVHYLYILVYLCTSL